MAGRPKKNSNEVKSVNKVEEVITKETIVEEKVEVNPQPKVKKQHELTEMICAKNNTHGKLIYVSKRYAGQTTEWEKFGDENYLELGELIAMRNSYPTYFKDCWIIIEDEEILEYLGVTKYYINIIDMNNFDSIFKKSPGELKELIERLPISMKESVAKRAKQMVKDGSLDSRKTIKALEETLRIDLQF